jgi:cell division protein FtsN
MRDAMRTIRKNRRDRRESPFRDWRDGNKPRNMRGGTLIGLALGLVVGVLISFGVVWFLNKTPLPFVDKMGKPEAKSNGEADKAPVALPGKPGDKPVERKFEFYDILEGKKQAAPDSAGTPTPKSPAPTATAVAPAVPVTPATPPAGGLFLQVGAFQKTADADNLKARLAMLGFEANVAEVTVPDKGVMHRVRIGPYASAEEMNRARGQLSQSSIPATVVRGKD